MLARYGQEARAQAKGNVLGPHYEAPAQQRCCFQMGRDVLCRLPGPPSAVSCGTPWRSLTGPCMALTTGAGAARGRQESGLGCRAQWAAAVLGQEQHRVTSHSLQLPSGSAPHSRALGARRSHVSSHSACAGKPEASLLLAPHTRGKSKSSRRRSRTGRTRQWRGSRETRHRRPEAAAEVTGRRD